MPLTVSIIVPIVYLCYIRRNIVTGGTDYRKGMAKFSLFLIVGGSINFFGQVFPSLMTLYSAGPGLYLIYGSAVSSLLPTPIIICGQLSKRRINSRVL